MRVKEKKEVGTFKVMMLGNSGCDEIIKKIVGVESFEENTLSTIGVPFRIKEVFLKNGIKIFLKFIDTGGQEKYRSISKSYLKNSDAVLFVFALNNKSSFHEITKWVKIFEENVVSCGRNKPEYLVGNKRSLQLDVSDDLIEKFIIGTKIKYYSVDSSLDHDNGINELVQDLAESIFENNKELIQNYKGQSAIKISKNEKEEKNKKEKKYKKERI